MIQVETLVKFLLLSSNSSLTDREKCANSFCDIFGACSSNDGGTGTREVKAAEDTSKFTGYQTSARLDFIPAITEGFALKNVVIVLEGEFQRAKSRKMASIDMRWLSANSINAMLITFDHIKKSNNYQKLLCPINETDRSGIFLLFSSQENLKLFLQKAYQEELFWSSYNKWFYSSNEPNWEKFLTETKIYLPFSVEFYVAAQEADNVNIFEVYHRSETSNIESNQVGVWKPEAGLKIDPSPLWERRKNLTGFHVKTAAMNDLPFINMIPMPYGSKGFKLIAYLAEVWNELQTITGFTYSVVESIDGQWGTLNEDGETFNGVVGMAERGEIDVGIASFYATFDRKRVVDFSIVLFNSVVKLYVKRPAAYAGWLTFINPFSWQLWIVAVVMVFVQAFVWSLTHKFNPGTILNKDEPPILTCLRSFCQQGASKEPIRVSTRIVFITTFFSSMVVFNSYGASLTSVLAVVRVHFPFKNVRELYENTNYRVGALQSTVHEDIFKREKEGVMADIYRDRFEPFSDVKDAVDRIKVDPEFSFLFQVESIEFMDDERCRIVTAEEAFYLGKIAFLFRKKFPYREIFNYYLTQMRERGQFRKMWNAWKPLPQKDCFAITEAAGVEFDKLKSITVFFVVLACVSVILLLLEWVNDRLRHRQSLNVNSKAKQIIKTLRTIQDK